MCLIVDANVAPTFFTISDPRFACVRSAVDEGKCCVYYGGELRREYEKIKRILRALLALDAAGRARAVPDHLVDAATDGLKHAAVCRSDDHHIIALAQVTGSRLLCTDDQALMEDFTDPQLISKPRGKIFRDASHRHLLPRKCP